MAKNFKRFLPLFLVVISGVIFLGDISQKILPLDQAQATEKEQYVPRNTRVITINSGITGRGLSHNYLKMNKNEHLQLRCIESFGDRGYSSFSESEGKPPGHEVKFFNEHPRRFVGQVKVPYNGYSDAISFPDSGIYELQIDHDPALTAIIEVIEPI